MGEVKNIILVNNGDKKKLCEICSTSYPTVRAALRGKEDTPLHLQIRAEAIKLGGAIRENA